MPQVSEIIPDPLDARVQAALSWFNASPEAGNREFKVTGIIDADATLRGSDELRLILCDGVRCEQRAFKVSKAADEWNVDFIDSASQAVSGSPQAELDPPPGPRLGWLDATLARHAFIVLLFYRGFW